MVKLTLSTVLVAAGYKDDGGILRPATLRKS